VKRTLSNRTINATLALLAQILEVAVEYRYIQFNPARGRRRRLKAAQPKRTWLEPEQVKPLLNATVCGLRGGKTMPDPKMRALFATATCTGLRIGELLALRWGDVNLAQGCLTVQESKTEAGTGREIDIWPELHDVLAAYKATTEHSMPADYVFATTTGKADTRSNIAKRLKRAVQRANEQLTGREGHLADRHRPDPALTAAHVRLTAVPARREPRLRHAPNGPHRPQARTAHLHQGHGRATPPRTRRAARRSARRGTVDRDRPRRQRKGG
jgi:integrase